jgi:hypothetical protein
MRAGRSTCKVILAVLLLGGCATKPQRIDTIDLVTPLPGNFDVEIPPAEIPKQIAQFSGIWKGDWLVTQPGSGPPGILHHTLVVKKIEPTSSGTYRATVIYSAGAPPPTWEDGGPGFWELSGTFGSDAMLRVKAPGPDSGQAVYTVSGDGKSLNGQYLLPGKSISGIFSKVR